MNVDDPATRSYNNSSSPHLPSNSQRVASSSSSHRAVIFWILFVLCILVVVAVFVHHRHSYQLNAAVVAASAEEHNIAADCACWVIDAFESRVIRSVGVDASTLPAAVSSHTTANVTSNTRLLPGDVVETGEAGYATLEFSDESRCSLGPGTRIRVHEFEYSETSLLSSRLTLRLEVGRLVASFGQSAIGHASVSTSLGNSRCRVGSTLGVSADDAGASHLFMLLDNASLAPGSVDVFHAGGHVTIETPFEYVEATLPTIVVAGPLSGTQALAIFADEMGRLVSSRQRSVDASFKSNASVPSHHLKRASLTSSSGSSSESSSESSVSSVSKHITSQPLGDSDSDSDSDSNSVGFDSVTTRLPVVSVRRAQSGRRTPRQLSARLTNTRRRNQRAHSSAAEAGEADATLVIESDSLTLGSDSERSEDTTEREECTFDDAPSSTDDETEDESDRANDACLRGCETRLRA